MPTKPVHIVSFTFRFLMFQNITLNENFQLKHDSLTNTSFSNTASIFRFCFSCYGYEDFVIRKGATYMAIL